jgi:glycosyltransferase involved in cell wall biosynthesis
LEDRGAFAAQAGDWKLMRILHLVHQYPPEFVGGVELYTQTLAQQLAQRDHAVSVCVPSCVISAELAQVTIENGVRVYRVPIGPRSSTAVFTATFGQQQISRAWAQVLEQTQPDLVHVQHMMGLPVNLIATLQQRDLPFVVTLHDYYYFCANALLLTNYDQAICGGPQYYLNCGRCAVARAGHNHRWAAPLAAPIMAARNRRLRFVLRQARHIIAPTHFVAEMYRRQIDLPLARVSIIPHGIAMPDSLPTRQVADRQHIKLLFIGGIAPHKGVHVLIDAVNQLPPEKIQLTIYGELAAFPDYAADLQRLARHPGITFAGKIPHDQVWDVLRNGDALIVPSLVYESSSLISQEALAMQTPVIASDLGALRETARRGGGLLCPPGDVIALRGLLQSLIDEPAQLDQLRASLHVPHSVGEHVTAIEALYREVRSS